MNLFLAESTSELTSTSESLSDTLVTWDWDVFWLNIINWIQTSGLKLLIGLVVLFILFKIVNIVASSIRKGMRKQHRDETVTNVVYSAVRKVTKVLLLLIFLAYEGIDTAGIGSIIASCAVAIGLALQGSLSNIAGWFIIIFMRPFKLGDFISAQNEQGTVEDIKLFYTYLKSTDNKVIMIPNGALANGNIINYSAKKIRRVDIVFDISYQDDVAKAIDIIKNVIQLHPLVLVEPESFVRMSKCDTSSIQITARAWTNNENYWQVHFDLIQFVKEEFDKNNITVPFNQLDVHISQDK